jgi:hypothetical protein
MARERIVVRTSTLMLALVLAGIPTAFSVFPEMANWPGLVRCGIGVAWLAVAGFTAKSSQQHEGRVQKLLDTQLLARERLRRSTLYQTLQNLLRPGTESTPDCYHWSVYLYDDQLDRLFPIFPEAVLDPQHVGVFTPGCGATGRAYERELLIEVTGDKVSDATHRLTPEQQTHYRKYRAVAATPIYDHLDQRIGVLTAIAEEEREYFSNNPGKAVMLELADTVGTLVTTLRLED